MTAVARHTDPETSKAAAASVSEERITWTQGFILALYREFGPLTDTALRQNYETLVAAGLAPMVSESGLRTRRNELTKKYRVIDTRARERLDSGRAPIVWGLAEEVQRNG